MFHSTVSAYVRMGGRPTRGEILRRGTEMEAGISCADVVLAGDECT
jgi:hypothetical protein